MKNILPAQVFEVVQNKLRNSLRHLDKQEVEE